MHKLYNIILQFKNMSNLPFILDIRNVSAYFYRKKSLDLDDDKKIFQQLADYNGKSVIIHSAAEKPSTMIPNYHDEPIVTPITIEKTNVEKKLAECGNPVDCQRLKTYLGILNDCPEGKSIVCRANSQNTDNIECHIFGFPRGIASEVTISKY